MARFFPIDSAIILSVKGKHSSRYLQARLTNDIRLIPIGGFGAAAALTPQGRTQGVFSIARTAELEYIIYADGGDRQSVVAAFRKYIVADQVTVDDLGDQMAVVHIFDCPHQHIVDLTSDVGPVHLLPKKRTPWKGFDVASSIQSCRALVEKLRANQALELSEESRTCARVIGGNFEFPTELNEDFLFSESGFLEIVSFKKGCYVGQEVIEKVDAFGSLPRKFTRVRFAGSVPIQPGSAVELVDSPRSAKIVTVATDLPGNNTIAVISLPLKGDDLTTVDIKTHGEVFTGTLFAAESVEDSQGQ